jgi:type I restriction enzyme S subunit
MGESYWSVFTRHDCASGYGVELLSQTDMFAAEPVGRMIRRESMPNADLHRIQKWQVLIAGAGQMNEGNLFGRSILADARLTHGYLGPHAVALTFKEAGSDQNLWTYAFLNTSAGLGAIKAAAFGTSVPGLRLDLLSAVPVPVAERSTMTRVAALMRKCVTRREASLQLFQAGRRELESLPAIQSASDACSRRTRRAVIWNGPFPTLGAWNYAGAGLALKELRRESQVRLQDFLTARGIHYGSRSVRIPCKPPFGVDFVAQRDAFLIRPIPRRVVLPDAKPEDLFSPVGSLMLAGRGTLGEGEIFGRCIQVAGPLEKLAFTGDMLRVNVLKEHSAFLYSFLSTHLGVQLVRTAAVGTKILQVRFDLLAAMPIPDVDDATRQKVTQLVIRANEERASAEAAEVEAIRIIEEEVLPQWLA